MADGLTRDELAAALERVRGRIATACADAGRDPAEVTLVAVTKRRPAADVALAAGLGLRDVGENTDQEARAKVAALADARLRWHMVGRLQRNKCRSVARWASVVHSVDRPELVDALSRAAVAAGRGRTSDLLTVLVQVSLDGDADGAARRDARGAGGRDPADGAGRHPARGAGRGGCDPADLPRLADALAAADGLRLAGVMAVAPRPGPGADPPQAAFARLAGLSAGLRQAHPAAGWISAGMSGDLEAAVAAGATHVRVGTALFGVRPPPDR